MIICYLAHAVVIMADIMTGCLSLLEKL